MKFACLLLLGAIWTRGASLRGTVTDPSGSGVPHALIRLRGPGGERRALSGGAGEYSFSAVTPGRYEAQVTATGFARARRGGLQIAQSVVLDVQLAIQAGRETITVAAETGAVTTAPGYNGGAVVLGQRQIAELSDDPDELALQLQALAGPAPGPDGGQVYIDGFTGSNLPPKSAIREVRVNSNPFSPEYDRPGFARIDIFTKPGSETLHGQAFLQYNDRLLNARNPLLAQATRPPYQARLYGLDAGGPLRVNRASFTVAAERRQIGENALVLATVLDAAGQPLEVNQALPAPQSRTALSPRLDVTLNAHTTLMLRGQEFAVELGNQGAGDFNLASRAYREQQRQHTAQLTATTAISPRALHEVRVQYRRSTNRDTGGSNAPALDVVGAFAGGGAPAGNSRSTAGDAEVSDLATLTRDAHSLKWGGRLRQTRLQDISPNNFAGTFTFYSLEQYRNGAAAQFSLSAGEPASHVLLTDAGIFAGDDWRARRNLTLSLGLRLETQSAPGGVNLAPRAALAWGMGGGQPKTVLRAGAGVFYDSLPVSALLNAQRYDGFTQQAYVIFHPPFYPDIPAAATLLAESQPQQLRPLYSSLRKSRLYQGSLGVERQLGASSKIAVTWIESRGLHLWNARNINTPIDGAWPFGDRSIRLLMEDAGMSRQRQMVVNANINRRRGTLFGYYALSYGKDNNEGLPANPYDLRAEWGASTYGDVRHRAVLGATVPLPRRFSVSPFLAGNTGAPYNITSGGDPLLTGFPTARPALSGEPGCRAAACFDSLPPAGTEVIPRGYGRGPAAFNLGLRASRTWAFGSEGPSGPANTGGPVAHAPGPLSTQTAPGSGRRYNLTLSASTLNALNHTNLGPPNGDLASPYFGQSRSLGGMVVMAHGGAAGTYNRKIDVELRFTF